MLYYRTEIDGDTIELVKVTRLTERFVFYPSDIPGRAEAKRKRTRHERFHETFMEAKLALMSDAVSTAKYHRDALQQVEKKLSRLESLNESSVQTN